MKMINALDNEFGHKTLTENMALSYDTTLSMLYDLFSFGGAYRERSDADVITLFRHAYQENPEYALKCLFYLRNIRGTGQGERRFFRVVLRWLAEYDTEAVRRNMGFVPVFGRWDDLYCLDGTVLEDEMYQMIKGQIAHDLYAEHPSLCAKWLKSINTSSVESKRLGRKTAKALGMTEKQYRKVLATLRQRLNVLEPIISANKWYEVQYDAIPSIAGMRYSGAFYKHDEERYRKFIMDKSTKVNAGALAPYQVVHEWDEYRNDIAIQREILNKYWDNLTDYFNGASLDGIVVCDTSGSMYGTPMEVAISLGMYCAQRNAEPYRNKLITFSERPQYINIAGLDFCDSCEKIYRSDWGMNTNIKAVFDMLLMTALNNEVKPEEMLKNVIIVSDMEYDGCVQGAKNATLFENIKRQWALYGYKLPHLIFWNCNARHNLIPMRAEENVTYVSGFSPSLFEQIMSGKSGYELMMEVLNLPLFADIH